MFRLFFRAASLVTGKQLCYNERQQGQKGLNRFMASLKEEIEKRRTFAIISHPDAGKTTLTEKFLLYGGAINTAGSVKGKATSKHAVSDWMEIEKERGISVTSSILQFHYDGYCINILDTPGHQDFSEDTYRTLMAADSAVMVIDGSKGVEAQTIKLFKVCALRHIPIFTFINKMDREAKDSFELLEDIEHVLGIKTCPVNWPIGSGKRFKGVYDRETRKVMMFQSVSTGGSAAAAEPAAAEPAASGTAISAYEQALIKAAAKPTAAARLSSIQAAVSNGSISSSEAARIRSELGLGSAAAAQPVFSGGGGGRRVAATK